MATISSNYIELDDIKKHSSHEDCWIVLHSKVYDVSSFLAEHPGGSAVIMKFAGQDATAAYDEVHAPSLVEETLSPEQIIGSVNPSELITQVKRSAESENGAAAAAVAPTVSLTHFKTPPSDSRPPLHSIISAHDFESAAQNMLIPKTFAFYSSAATDLCSHRANLRIWQKLLLRPRVLINVREVNTRRSIMGCDCSSPFFVSPAAMAKLAHPDGELAIARACGNDNIIQIISSNASYSLSDIVKAAKPNQPLFFQLYVNSERHKTEATLRKAKSFGIKAIFVTVDAPIPGKREADERLAAEASLSSGMSGEIAMNDKKGGGLGRVMAKYIDSSLNWEDLAWIKKVSGGLPLVLKGVQTAVDAKRAMQSGVVDGILLSNHGGRSLDTVQPAILTLLEIHKYCPEVLDSRLEIYVDGGIRRGTDILKAIALGATAVGIARPYLYALTYGQKGVEHLTDILKDELVSAMKLAGITSIDEAHPGMVNTKYVEKYLAGNDHEWIRWRPKAKL